jgi:Zn-dependent M28 family amino/carboxypeptidase
MGQALFYNVGKRSFRRMVLLSAVASVFLVQAAPAQTFDAQALLATVRTLASPEYEGRRTGAPGGLKARAWVAARFKAIGLQPVSAQYLFPFSFTRTARGGGSPTEYKDAANIVGLCKGSSGVPDAIVMSAHYDHNGVRDGVMYPGADDNASGVAVLLALAERCVRTPFLHDVVFVAFDAEELGLQGARAFVAAPPIAKERIGLNVNLDMVSRSDRNEIFAAGTSHWPRTKPVLEAVAKRAQVTLRLGHDQPATAGNRDDWTNQSDHGAFHAAGIPFVYFGVEDHADYHKPTDTADKIDPTFFAHVAEMILDAVKSLDAAMPFRP